MGVEVRIDDYVELFDREVPTEVYPDGPKTTENGIEAQVASVTGARDCRLESDGHKAQNP